MGEELPSWRGTCPLRSKGPKGGMWLWKVHFRIQKHTLPVCLNASLSIYCMYSTFQTARQTDTSGEQPMEGCPPFPSFLPAPCLCHPTQRGEVVRLEWLARRASCVTTVCVYGREGGRDPQALLQTQLHTGPHKQLLHSQRQPSRATLQDLYCHNMRMYACVLLSITNKNI